MFAFADVNAVNASSAVQYLSKLWLGRPISMQKLWWKLVICQ